MQSAGAPPVVAVVVTHEPGPWMEACLASLAAQDYPSCSILVVDQASTTELAGRVATVAPSAYLWRCEDNHGFGPGANEVLQLVEGAAFYLFCHDDVVLRPHALHQLVEEAFRSNAGVVGPKLVDEEAPERILQLGLGVDRLGAPVRRIGRHEVDQAQHDEVAEVFAVPGGCTLVRADLFGAIGGFDPEIRLLGEDVDLCWRARLAGARVVVTPAAVVGHLEATASRRRPCPEARSLQWRHELRAVLKNYGRLRRSFAVAQLLVLSLAEIAYFAAIGKTWRARQVVDAWRWNLATARRLGDARAAVATMRRVPERDVCALLARRSLRVSRFAWPMLEARAAARRARPRPAAERSPAAAVPSGRRPRGVVAVAVVAALVLLVGSRSLVTGAFPVVGGLLPIPSPGHLLATFLGGTTAAGFQHPGPASPALGLLGLASALLVGGNGLLLHLLVLGSLVLGAFGAQRLVRPLAAAPGRLVAGLGALFLPLAWNDVARGDLVGCFAFASAPWLLTVLARAVESASDGRWAVVRLSFVLALAAAFVPADFLLVPALAVAFALGSLAVGQRREAARSVVVGFAGTVGAFALCLPWSVTFLQPGARLSALLGATSLAPSASPGLGHLLRLAVGPTGGGLLGWGLLAAAGLVLLVGTGPRLALGVRLWFAALATYALAWSSAEGWLGAGGALRVLLAPAAACLAGALGLGAAAIQDDLRRTGLGWRHLATAACGLCAVAGLLPVLGAALGGRWGLPESGYESLLSWTSTPARPAPRTTAGGGPRASARVDTSGHTLWLGDPAALPASGWQVAPGLAAEVTDAGLPRLSNLWPPAVPGAATAVLHDVVLAEQGRTVELGHLLAPYDIRYVVVPTTIAPQLPPAQRALPASPPQALLDALTAQSDLRALPGAGGALVFLDAAWTPTSTLPADLSGGATTPALLRVLGVALEVLALATTAAALARRGRRRAAATHRRPLSVLPARRRHAGRAAGEATGSAPEPAPDGPADGAPEAAAPPDAGRGPLPLDRGPAPADDLAPVTGGPA